MNKIINDYKETMQLYEESEKKLKEENNLLFDEIVTEKQIIVKQHGKIEELENALRKEKEESKRLLTELVKARKDLDKIRQKR